MKISDLKIFFINVGGKTSYGTGNQKNWLLLKIYTDEGVDGIGEAFHGLDEPIEAAIAKFSRWLTGKDPTKILHHWQAIYRGLRYPLGTAELSALSAIEHALWDISGKACGLPVYKMLGGPCRDRVRVYASGYLCQPSHFEKGEDSLVNGALSVVERGFTAMKFTPQPDDFQGKSPQQIHVDAVERVRSVREAVGPDVDIGLDYHGRSFSPAEAVRLCEAIEPYHPLFIEEPALTEAPESLHEVKMKTRIPVAGGERCINRSTLKDILQKDALHILQPEPTANGGILETVKWAAICELYHVTIAPHHACSPVALAVCGHIDSCIPNFLIQECNVDLQDPLVRECFTTLPRLEDGYLILSDRPGLGIEFNEAAAEAHPFKPYDRPVIVQPDGAIGLE